LLYWLAILVSNPQMPLNKLGSDWFILVPDTVSPRQASKRWRSGPFTISLMIATGGVLVKLGHPLPTISKS